MIILILMISHHVFCCSAPVRSARASSAEGHFENLNRSIREMSRGKWTLDVGLLHSPERFYRARTASQEDVNRLADSFSTYVSKSEQSMVVLFWPEDQPLIIVSRLWAKDSTTTSENRRL